MMKKTFYILFIVVCFAVYGLTTACSSSDKGGIFNKIALTLEDEVIEFSDKNLTQTVEITSGNGGYTVAVYPENATVTASVTGNTITIQSVSYGASNIVITDREGVKGHIQAMVYGEVQLSQYEFTELVAGDRDINYPVKPAIFRVTFGKPDYSIVSDYDIDYQFDGRDVLITPYEAGNITVRVYDATGHYAEIKMEVEDPFETFKTSSNETFTYSPLNVSSFYEPTDNNRVEGGDYVFNTSYSYFSTTYYTFELKIPVSQTLSEGLKEGATFSYTPRTGTGVTEENVIVKVVKNEDGKVWIVYYATDQRYNGRICKPLIPN